MAHLRDSAMATDSHSTGESSWQEIKAASRDLASRATERFHTQEALLLKRREETQVHPAEEAVWSRVKEHTSDVLVFAPTRSAASAGGRA